MMRYVLLVIGALGAALAAWGAYDLAAAYREGIDAPSAERMVLAVWNFGGIVKLAVGGLIVALCVGLETLILRVETLITLAERPERRGADARGN